jgi:hypothetical protein
MLGQLPLPADSAVTLASTRVQFLAPQGWRVLDLMDSDSVNRVIFHVPSSATDSVGPERTNVLVTAFRHLPAGASFDTLTADLFASMSGQGSVVVLSDSMLAAPERRFLFWRGQQGATPYVIVDDFARIAGMVIHVRMAMPVLGNLPRDWTRRFSADTERLLASIRVDGQAAFPGWVAHPSVRVF